jgi:hypothetical protein
LGNFVGFGNIEPSLWDFFTDLVDWNYKKAYNSSLTITDESLPAE